VGLAQEWFKLGDVPEGVELEPFVAGIVAERLFRGTFGVRFVDNQLWEFIAVLRAHRRGEGSDDRQLLQEVLPNPAFVWLRRRDTVAQAVSYVKARQTNQWWSAGADAPGVRPVFDFEAIDERVAGIVQNNEAWKRWFDESGITALEVDYEVLNASPVDETRRVLEFLGIEPPRSRAIREQSARQRNAVDDDWVARYRAIAGVRSTETPA